MSRETSNLAATIRPAVAVDADEITGIFLESAEYHASFDSERYFVPAAETISARYKEGRQHSLDGGESVTFVAELGGEIVGFIDARLYRPLDAMHREITFCLVSEIAVGRKHQSQGIGGELLRKAEDWGRERGAKFALLEYHAANTLASRFYHEHMGYRAASTTAVKRL